MVLRTNGKQYKTTLHTVIDHYYQSPETASRYIQLT